MTKLEKISSIIGLIVIGAGIFSHYMSLQGDVIILKKKQMSIITSIQNNEKIIIDLKSHYESTDTDLDNNKDLITFLQNQIVSQQDRLDSLMTTTHQLLIKIIEKQR